MLGKQKLLFGKLLLVQVLHALSTQISIELIPLINSLSTNPTKWSETLKPFVTVADELFECVWPFCGVGA